MKRTHIEYTLNKERRDISAYGEYQGGPLKTFKAEYRSNAGMFRSERFFRAPDVNKAEVMAREALPDRKPKDIFWMTLHRITEVGDEVPALTSNPETSD